MLKYIKTYKGETMIPKSEEVFKPGAFPEHTYIPRKFASSSISYELRLQQALKISGCLTSLVGPSKMGKTILCEKVIGLDHIVEVSGADFSHGHNFWEVVAARAELPYHGEFTTSQNLNGTHSQESFGKKEHFTLTKDKVIEYYKKHDLVLVLDDFHYAPKDVQLQIAQQLKDAIRREFKAVVVSLPHRSDDAIRQNADLSGRLSLINIEPWTTDELKQIALKGFPTLGIHITDAIATKIATESLTSPQLMQYICLSICTLLDSDNAKIEQIEDTILPAAYQFTTMNFEYGDIVKVITAGPNPRGRQRKLFPTITGKRLDLYGLFIESLAKDPPIVELSFNDLYTRIDALLISNIQRPQKRSVRDALHNLQEILNTREDIYRVIEWKDSIIYVLDPLFLFYLRWGRDTNGQV
jgi:hypothetical protein